MSNGDENSASKRPSKSKPELAPEVARFRRRLIKVAAWIAGIGFLITFAGAVMLGPGPSQFEEFGSFTHRAGQYTMLAGFLTLIVGYRWGSIHETLENMRQLDHSDDRSRSGAVNQLLNALPNPSHVPSGAGGSIPARPTPARQPQDTGPSGAPSPDDQAQQSHASQPIAGSQPTGVPGRSDVEAASVVADLATPNVGPMQINTRPLHATGVPSPNFHSPNVHSAQIARGSPMSQFEPGEHDRLTRREGGLSRDGALVLGVMAVVNVAAHAFLPRGLLILWAALVLLATFIMLAIAIGYGEGLLRVFAIGALPAALFVALRGTVYLDAFAYGGGPILPWGQPSWYSPPMGGGGMLGLGNELTFRIISFVSWAMILASGMFGVFVRVFMLRTNRSSHRSN